MKTWKQGALSFVPHFGLWALPVYFTSYFCDSLGVSYVATMVSEITVALAVLAITLLAEGNELRDRKQTRGKMYLDRTAKIGGIIVSLLTAGWWRELL